MSLAFCARTSERLQPQASHCTACNRGKREGGEEFKVVRREPSKRGNAVFPSPLMSTAPNRGIRYPYKR